MPLPIPVLRAVQAAVVDRHDGPILQNKAGLEMKRAAQQPAYSPGSSG